MDYEKAYKQALERARKIRDEIINNEILGFPGQITDIFPELRESESEDERIRKVIYKLMLGMREEIFTAQDEIVTKDRAIAWLEKQKDLMPPTHVDPCDASWYAYYQRGLNKGYELGLEAGKKEQKPWKVGENAYFTPDKETPFKTKLAEYLQNNSPKDGKYVISSESILEMAKEELIKRGELQKPVEYPAGFYVTFPDGKKYYTKEMRCNNMKIKVVEPKPVVWSEKDRKILDDVSHILVGLNYKQVAQDYKQAVENLLSLRPSWKPSAEQMEALQRAIDACESEWDYQDDELRSLLNDLQKL